MQTNISWTKQCQIYTSIISSHANARVTLLVCAKQVAGAAQAHAITVEQEDNTRIPDNIIDALAVQEAIEEELLLSINVLSGVEQTKTIRFRALIGNQVVLILLDFGSTHSFIDSIVVPRIVAETIQLQKPLIVKVANGETLACTFEVSALTWWLQGNTFTYPAKVVELGDYDIILGVDWLEQWGAMTCHWKEKWVEFQYQDKLIKLQGIQTCQQSKLKEMYVDQVVKCYKGNNISATTILFPQDPAKSDDPPVEVHQLLQTFPDVFQEPTSLPPVRALDHATHTSFLGPH